ncbi:amidohydrolase family protein [Microbulbifer thermotolerans]|uniref:amidohydrolase family protein n=1 Tax=Microbulbifer thermotolerans TaxID=252514 RepID=UPI002249727E|nr:amidohydrolase family protein [Microbulbifer thermotolerans]MCX2782810.1 amidohydrolase family protein [Microbulbifer thermotolerans]MCX2794111.1 amidohydrolase family protein [Microbulbifer thermotolerans]MCX2841008.1 amidohydrolase family protein [Microbulbifer thermotolerans]
MKPVWLICAAALLVACGRPEPPADEGGGPVAELPSGQLQERPLELPGVERAVDLRAGRSPEDYVRAVADFMRDNPDLQVIVGKGWDAAAFGTARPHKALLDQVSDFVPIVLISRDHMSIWTNSEGLAAAGINSDTPNPEGGVIEKDENGLAIGVLRGRSAVALLEKIIPRAADAQPESNNTQRNPADTQ